MESGNKILILSICLILLPYESFVEGGSHGGHGSDIGTLLAAGLITMLLSDHGKSSGGYGHSHALSAGSLIHGRGLIPGGLPIGHGLNFGDLRYGHELIHGGLPHGHGLFFGGMGHGHGLITGRLPHSHGLSIGDLRHGHGLISGELSHSYSGGLSYFPGLNFHELLLGHGLNTESLFDGGNNLLSNGFGHDNDIFRFKNLGEAAFKGLVLGDDFESHILSQSLRGHNFGHNAEGLDKARLVSSGVDTPLKELPYTPIHNNELLKKAA